MKKIFAILIFASVFGMMAGSVFAADLHPYDFDGKFTMDVPSDDFDRHPVGTNTFNDKSNNLKIQYYTIDEIHERNCNSFDEYINQLTYDKVGTDGDLSIFKNKDDNIVIFHSDDVMVIITADDLQQAKTIAKSADFGEDNATNETSDSSNASANKDLKSQNFFGFFKMDVPKDSDFGDTEDSDKKVVADTVYYTDEVNNITIQYMNNEAFDDNAVKQTVDGLKQSGADVSVEGDLYVISGNGTNEVIFHDGPKTFTIYSNHVDLDTLKDMASSIEITDK